MKLSLNANARAFRFVSPLLYAFAAIWLALAATVIVGCGGSASAPAASAIQSHPSITAADVPARPRDVTTVRVYRTCERTLHVDTVLNDFEPLMQSAAREIETLTSGNVRFHLVFDLDFESTASLREHRDDDVILGALSIFPVIKGFDERLGRVSAVTTSPQLGEPPAHVYLVLDRIEPDDLRNVVMHELGHVAGLPDLETFGNVMSRRKVVGVPGPATFTAADRALYRTHLFIE